MDELDDLDDLGCLEKCDRISEYQNKWVTDSPRSREAIASKNINRSDNN
jgi:hypothetical protein